MGTAISGNKSIVTRMLRDRHMLNPDRALMGAVENVAPALTEDIFCFQTIRSRDDRCSFALRR